MIKISVIIPTYNPNWSNLEKTLEGLRNQDLPFKQWEIILVDNASTNDVIAAIDITWHPNFRIVKESQPGLTFARIKGYMEAESDLMVFVDDDNVLKNNYLSTAISLFERNFNLGVAGGKSIGIFEIVPAEWLKEFYSLIAVRPIDHPETITGNLDAGYPEISPIGAGMVVKKECFKNYFDYIKSNREITLDRTGKNLSSGGDNEINIVSLKSGHEIGFFSELSLAHLISKDRLQVSYLKRLNYSSNRSWVKVLYAHDLCPWKPIRTSSLPLRHLKAFFKYKPWNGASNKIRFAGALGMFKGLSELKSQLKH
jgi:glycosyltransferase involved in cell wall biosynthesis